jgi:hypothetical protein
MKKLMTIMMIAMLGMAFTFTSCKKDDDDDDNSYPTNINFSNGYINEWGQWGNGYNFSITLTTSGINLLDFTGSGHIAYFELLTDSPTFNGGTFVYNSSENPGTFDDCEIVINGNISTETASNYFEATNGTITITPDGNNFDITYTITVQEYESDYYENPIGDPATMTGSYSGPLTSFDWKKESGKKTL